MSAKTSNQPGRRTPLSLSGGVSKGQVNNSKGGNGGGNSTNGHTNNNKQENKQQKNEQQQQQTNAQKQQQTNAQKQQQQTNAQKQQQQQQTDTKENPGKVQNKQNQNESKIPKPQTGSGQSSDNNKQKQQQQQPQQQSDNKKISEKQQNGVAAPSSSPANSNKNTTNQPQNNKEKQASTNVESKAVDEKEKSQEKSKSEKQEKPEKSIEDAKAKDNKKDDKEQKLNADNKSITDATVSKDTKKDTVESMDVVVEEQAKQKQQDVPKASPAKPKSAKDTSKSNTPSKGTTDKTPTKASASVEMTPTKATEKTTPKSRIVREVTTAIDDVEMEPLTVDQSPKKEADQSPRSAVAVAGLAPSATSTPGKVVLPKRNATAAKTDVQLAMEGSSSPERPRAFSQISGRRAIRPITDYTPSKFQSNSQFRESYRRINTELDATNTSLNVTVGSEVPNNSSFSFFGRGRKRDRTPPHHHSQSAIGELQTDMEISPPKRARLDFFSVVASPLTLLRNRFSKATLQSSTPVKLQTKMEENEDEDIEVQNVSGVSVHEDIEKPEHAKGGGEAAEEGDTTLGVEAAPGKDLNTTPIEGELEIDENGEKELSTKLGNQISEDGDIKITVTDTAVKNKRCIVM
ncbi:kugelkern [Haematobia irritans]|uniref:kugelkern n=1 Tax=Haematobia irritans TaxID=7368 RepID=UPI003F4FD5BB